MGLFLIPLAFLAAWIYDKIDARIGDEKYRQYKEEYERRCGNGRNKTE